MKHTLLFALLILALACQQKPKNSEESTADNPVLAETDTSATTNPETLTSEQNTAKPPSAAIALKGIYATSTQIPSSQFGYDKMFDNNTSTYWSTMPGAGPGEGIMLYFDKPQNFSGMEIIQAQGENFAPIQQVVIYINGQRAVMAELHESKLTFEAQEVSSLFIKIEHTGGLEEEMIEEKALLLRFLSSDMMVGISEIRLYQQQNPVALALPQLVKGSIKASSTLKPEASYGVSNLFDSKKEFGWAEGSAGSGENESLSFQFESEQSLSALQLMNGFQRSEKHFTANARLKTALLSNENKEEVSLSFADQQGEQTAQLPKTLKGKSFQLLIKEVYPGTQYKDLVISELKFISPSGVFIAEDPSLETNKKALIRKVRDTPLESVLDKRIFNSFEEMDSYKRSLILRSDNTFVAYSEEWNELSSGTESKEVIAEGNWEIKELSPDKVVVRVFGKLTRLSESSDYYSGSSSSSYLQIFQDNVTITYQGVSGEKFIEEMFLMRR